MYNYVDLSCPNCRTEDHVQKVSSIVESGTIAGTSIMYVDGIRYVANNQSQTVLSRLLSPPPQPTYPLKSSALTFVLSLIGISGILVLFVSGGDMPPVVTGLILLATSALLLFLQERDFKQVKATAVAQVPEWRRAVERWRLLYYCHRCNVLFPQDKTFTMAPRAMRNFLYGEFR